MGGKRPSKKLRQHLQELNASPKAGFECSPSGLRAQMKKAQGETMQLRANVERLHQQLSDTMADFQQVQADMEQLQAEHQEVQGENESLQQQVEERTHSHQLLHHDQRRLFLALRNVRRCRLSGPRLTRRQRQLLNILMRHQVSPEMLQRCAEGGYGMLDTHGNPTGCAFPHDSPTANPPALTANFIPTQVGRRGKPAARTTAYLAQHFLSTARLVLQTHASNRKLAMCRELFVNEQCQVPNPYRPRQSTTVRRQLHVVAKHQKSKTLEMLKQASAIHLAFDGCTTKRHGKVLVVKVTAAVPKPQGEEQLGHEGQVERAGHSCSVAAPNLTTIVTDVVGVIQLANGTVEAHVRVFMQMLVDLGLAGMNIAGICADSASVNIGEFTGVIARISQLLQEEGQVGVTRAQPCYSHGIHNTLLKGLGVLPGTRSAIIDLSSLLAQHEVALKLDRGPWDAVAEVQECEQRRAPAWAREVCKHLQDSDLLPRITVVAVVGQTYLMPKRLWASKDDGLHAFELYRHIQQVCKDLQQPWANNAVGAGGAVGGAHQLAQLCYTLLLLLLLPLAAGLHGPPHSPQPPLHCKQLLWLCVRLWLVPWLRLQPPHAAAPQREA
ncbi:hypothetical protein QJQ45_001893 [Haematococcus lacustris]|nr:hypothetical protein QJQ45_001893 [Haematococcus lacustris]